MFHPKALLAACVWLGATFTAYGQTNYVVELPAGTSGQYFPYSAATSSSQLSQITAAAGPAGMNQIIPKADGTQFFLIGSSGVQFATSTFSQPTSILSGLTSAPVAAMTPNGQYLLVAADKLYAISTASDQILWSLSLPANAGTGIVGIAFSRDSARAYAVTSSGVVQQYNIGTPQTAQLGPSLATANGATSITLSPLGLLYVSGVNAIFEINPSNPATLTLTSNGQTGNYSNGVIGLFFNPGPLRFTADGAFAYAANIDATRGGALLQLNLATYQVRHSEYTSVPQMTDVFVATDSTASTPVIFAFSQATGTLWDVNVSSAPGCPAQNLTCINAVLDTMLPTTATTSITAVALSNEVPWNTPSSSHQGARSIFLLSTATAGATIYQVSLVTNSIVSYISAGSASGTLAFVPVPPQTGTADFLLLNNQQNLGTGAVSAPMIARVLTANGAPIYNMAVTFSCTASIGTCPTIATSFQNTTVDGYVIATATASGAPGVYSIVLTTADNTGANNGQATFTLTVGGAGGGGGGGGGGGITGASSQVSIVSGDGAFLLDEGGVVEAATTGEVNANPMTILVTDTNGNPLNSVPVTFSILTGNGSLISSPYSATSTSTGAVLTTTTDINGHALADFQGAAVPQGSDAAQTVVNATTQYGSVNFTMNTYRIELSGVGTPEEDVRAPNQDSSPPYLVTLTEGVPVSNAIQMQVYGNDPLTGFPIPGVSIYTENPYSPAYSPGVPGYLPPAASCMGSTLSDQNGIAHCTLVTTCAASPGMYNLTVLVGGTIQQPANGVNVLIKASGASKVTAASGNNQSGSPGQTLPGNLVAVVTDACNNPVGGQLVNWTVSPANAVTFLSEINKTNGIGQASTQVQLGQIPGAIQVTATAGSASVVFSITNTLRITVASVTATSGNGQTATVGQAFAQPVVFTVTDTTGSPVSGANLAFSVSPAGAATVATPSGTATNAQGQVSITVTAGSTAESITITATTASVSGTAILSALAPPPSITPASFTNAASGAVGLVPCGLGTVTGNGVAPNVVGQFSSNLFGGPLGYILQGFSMSVDGIPAPLQAISNVNGVQSVNFQTPCEVPVGPGTVVITVNNVTTTINNVQINQAQPGLFTYVGPNGKSYGEVISASDGSYVTSSNYAVHGQSYFVLVTGLGEGTPAIKTDNAGTGQLVSLPVQVGVSNAGVPTLSALYATGFIGVYAVEFTIPTTTSTGAPWPTGADQNLAVYVTLPNGQQVFGNGVLLPGIQ